MKRDDNKRLTVFPDRREWDLTGFTLTRVSFDYALTLLISSPAGSLTVIIETPCQLHTGSHIEPIDPEQPVPTAHRLLRLLHRSAVSLTAFHNGLLVVMFDDGTKIQVPKDEQYESWQTFGSGDVADMNMLCSPHEGSPWGD